MCVCDRQNKTPSIHTHLLVVGRQMDRLWWHRPASQTPVSLTVLCLDFNAVSTRRHMTLAASLTLTVFTAGWPRWPLADHCSSGWLCPHKQHTRQLWRVPDIRRGSERIVLQPAEDSDVRPQFLRMSAVVIISIIRLVWDINIMLLNWTEPFTSW